MKTIFNLVIFLFFTPILLFSQNDSEIFDLVKNNKLENQNKLIR